MKTKLAVLMGLMLTLIFSAPSWVIAQSGCPDVSLPAVTQYEVLESQVVAPVMPENAGPQATAHGIFYQNQISVAYKGQRVILSGSATGAQVCIDDELLLIVDGREFRYRFQSRDGSRIVPAEPIDVSHLFTSSSSTVSVMLIDSVPQFYSASSVYLLQVAGTPPPAPTAVPPAPISFPQGSVDSGVPEVEAVEPTPTAVLVIPTPIAVLVTAELVTDTPVVAEVATVPDPPLLVSSEPPTAEVSGSGGWLPWWAMAAVGLVVGVGGWWVAQLLRTLLPPGELVVYEQGVYQQTVELARFKKNRLLMGSGKVDIGLEGVPAVAARVTGHRDEHGQRYAVLEMLDPENPQDVVEQFFLRHDDGHQIGDYKLVYRHYQAEKSFYEGSLTDDKQ